MKNTICSVLLILAFNLFWIVSVEAQCPVTLSGPLREFSPAPSTVMPAGRLGQPYSQTIEVFVPIRDKVGTDSVDVLNYTFSNLSDVPSDLNVTVPSGSYVFPSGASSCVKIEGIMYGTEYSSRMWMSLRVYGVTALGDTVNEIKTIGSFDVSFVYGPPRATFTYSGTIDVCEGETLIFSRSNSNTSSAQSTTYSWSAPGATRIGVQTPDKDTLQFNTAGVHNVVLTASDTGGVDMDTVIINVFVNPTISISSYGFSAGCGGSAVLKYAPGASLKVDNPNAGFTYEWLFNGSVIGGATDTVLVPTSPGIYTSRATSGGPCVAISNGFTLQTVSNFDVDICVVTVDTTTGKNELIWEKPVNACIDTNLVFVVWKESAVTGVYDSIDAVAYTAFSTYIDNNSNPLQQADKYRLSILESSGLVSAQSTPHKTIHLTVNVGQGNTRNLLWNAYEGASVSTYNIYRGTNSTNMTLLTSVSGSNTSYTDLSPMGSANIYQIELVLPYACTPSKVGNAASKSNLAEDGTTGIANPNLEHQILISPNPASQSIQVEFEGLDVASVSIITLTGQIALQPTLPKLRNQMKLDISSLETGVYFVGVKLNSGEQINKKIVVY